MTKRAKPDRQPTFSCPHCGAEVRSGAVFCPNCGASDESGWSEGDEDCGDWEDGYGEQDFDYQEFLRREFPDQAEGDSRGFRRLLIAAVVLLLCAGLILMCCF